jgi:hypothetical protein
MYCDNIVTTIRHYRQNACHRLCQCTDSANIYLIACFNRLACRVLQPQRRISKRPVTLEVLGKPTAWRRASVHDDCSVTTCIINEAEAINTAPVTRFRAKNLMPRSGLHQNTLKVLLSAVFCVK